jgi:hypothetical protein
MASSIRICLPAEDTISWAQAQGIDLVEALAQELRQDPEDGLCYLLDRPLSAEEEAILEQLGVGCSEVG